MSHSSYPWHFTTSKRRRGYQVLPLNIAFTRLRNFLFRSELSCCGRTTTSQHWRSITINYVTSLFVLLGKDKRRYLLDIEDRESVSRRCRTSPRTLHEIGNGNAFILYIDWAKHQGSDKSKKKIESVEIFCKRYGDYRQIFGWSFLKLFHNGQFLLQKENTFENIFRRTLKELQDEQILDQILDINKVLMGHFESPQT